MRKLVTVLAVVVLGALALAALSRSPRRARAMGVVGEADRGAGGPEAGRQAPTGSGSFTGTLKGNKLTWKLTFSGLSGAATAAHIHLGAMGKAGNVVVALCGPCKSGDEAARRRSRRR